MARKFNTDTDCEIPDIAAVNWGSACPYVHAGPERILNVPVLRKIRGRFTVKVFVPSVLLEAKSIGVAVIDQALKFPDA